MVDDWWQFDLPWCIVQFRTGTSVAANATEIENILFGFSMDRSLGVEGYSQKFGHHMVEERPHSLS